VIRINPDACDKRKVVIQRRQDDGTWKTVSTVFACDHIAGEVFITMVAAAHGAVMAGYSSLDLIPDIRNYQLAYVDELPEGIDDAIEDMTQACNILNEIKGKTT